MPLDGVVEISPRDNGKCLAVINYLAKKISFILPAQQPIQQNNRDLNKRSVSHVNKEKSGKAKSRNGVDISDTKRFFSSEEWIKNRKNPDVLKKFQDCPRRNKKE